jgi:hypothetical protein
LFGLEFVYSHRNKHETCIKVCCQDNFFEYVNQSITITRTTLVSTSITKQESF